MNGERVFLSINAAPLLTSEGIFNGMVATVEDITEKMAFEQKIKESEQKFRTLAEQSLIGLSILQDNQTKFVNKQFADIIGYPLEEIKTWNLKSHLDIVHPDYIDFIRDQTIKKQIGNPDVLEQYEFCVYDKIGNLKWIHNFSKTISYEGRPADLVSFIDITEQKKIEEELKNSEKQYRKAYNRAEFYKDLFAHDINNILHNILMGVQLNSKKLKELGNVENLEDVNNIIREQVNRGAKLVSNIRKISQIEELQYPLKPTEITRILKNSIDFIEKSFQYKTLFIKCDTEIKEIFINGNEFVQEIFDNILMNAIKFTVSPNIYIQIKISKEIHNNKIYFKLQFIDNGIGIPDSIKKKIFIRSHHIGDNIGGMGLGLSLVKKIVESYRGDIWVEDKIKGDSSQGSNFIVLFPELEKKKENEIVMT